MTTTEQQLDLPALERVVLPAARERRDLTWRRLLGGRCTGVFVGLVLVMAYLSITQPVFLTWGNMTNIIKSNSATLMLSLGATFVIISSGLDLSAVSAATAAGMILALALNGGIAAWLCVVVTLAFGLLLGLVNGVMISKFKISFLVVTLGTLSVYQSVAEVLKSGQTEPVFGLHNFSVIGSFVGNSVGPFPIVMLFDAALVIVAGGILRGTTFGRALFAVGSNREAARLNGINVGRIFLIVYGIGGLAAALSGVIQVGRLTGAAPTSDPTLLLTELAAVLIGGTAYTGGEGGVLGTVVGVAFLGVIQNGLTLSNVSTFWQGTVSGLILIVAVGLGVLRDRGWRPRRSRVPA
jgi:ribose transport system permease protein